MVLNGRKKMKHFTKGDKISGISGLKESLLLYVVMWKGLYNSLYHSPPHPQDVFFNIT